MITQLFRRGRRPEGGLRIERTEERFHIPKEGKEEEVLLKRELIGVAFQQASRTDESRITTLGYFGMFYPKKQVLIICQNPLSLATDLPVLTLDRFMYFSFTPHKDIVWNTNLDTGEGNLPKEYYENPKSTSFLNPRKLKPCEAYIEDTSWIMGDDFYRATFSAGVSIDELVEMFKVIKKGWPTD